MIPKQINIVVDVDQLDTISDPPQAFWALKDINREIQQWDGVGITDLLLVGDIDQYHLNDLSRKVEQYIQRKIRHLVLTPSEFVTFKPDLIHHPNLLIWAADKE